MLDNTIVEFVYRLGFQGYQFIGSTVQSDGTISHGSQQCQACKNTEYVLNSSDSKFRCQPCPQGASCNGNDLKGLVSGSLWIQDLQRGIYVLQFCPSGFELVRTLPGSPEFSATSQRCELCPASFFCVGGMEARMQCPAGTFTRAGANHSSSCLPVVFVVVTFSLPISKSDLTHSKQQDVVAALASAAQCDVGKVFIETLVEARRVSASTTLTGKIAADDQAEGQSIMGLLSQDSLSTELSKRGLPRCFIISIVVLKDSSQNSFVIVGAVLGAIFGAGILAAISILLQRGSKRASHRLIGAGIGSPANQDDLPSELRQKYEVIQVIGSGTFSVVLEAWQLTNNRRRLKRAIKLVISPSQSLSETEIRRLDREV
jgi:hypothetical protein